jgi:hypothetical protein
MPIPIQVPVIEKPAPIDNTQIVENFRREGGGLVHIRPGQAGGSSTRGMTFAYKRKGSRIEFSTSVQHRNDAFCKKIGTKLAIEHFLAGKTVTFPMKNTRKVAEFLNDVAFWAVR